MYSIKTFRAPNLATHIEGSGCARHATRLALCFASLADLTRAAREETYAEEGV